jgi:hypothetical protein
VRVVLTDMFSSICHVLTPDIIAWLHHSEFVINLPFLFMIWWLSKKGDMSLWESTASSWDEHSRVCWSAWLTLSWFEVLFEARWWVFFWLCHLMRQGIPINELGRIGRPERRQSSGWVIVSFQMYCLSHLRIVVNEWQWNNQLKLKNSSHQLS